MMKTVILLLALSALASPHSSRRRYGSGGFGNSGFGGHQGAGAGSGTSYGGDPINFPTSHLHLGGIRPGSVGRPGSVVRPGGGSRPVGDEGFRPGTDCSPKGCPVGPMTPRVTYLDQCYNIDTTSAVHDTYGNSQYHFSWCVDGGQKYNWANAQNYCERLHGNWRAVSIEDYEENAYITDIVETHRLPYIWTSGQRSSKYYDQFVWNVWRNGPKKIDLKYTNWGQTGMQGLPQPDNNDPLGEKCLAVINYFYPGDYTTWHDIHCRHSKPVICEKAARYGYTG